MQKVTSHVTSTPIDLTQYIPQYNIGFVPTENFATVLEIVKSNKFYPIWVTGLAGCGKSQMIEQAFASANLPDDFFDKKTPITKQFEIIKSGKYPGKPFIRVNFTTETDESQLIGGYEMINGETVYREGPVTIAVRHGFGLLFDEIDLGHVNRVMLLQPVLEGRGLFIKEKNEWVTAAPGFQVFATSNTKGRGSDDGKFAGVNILNAAMLDRFCGVIEQDYPDEKTEKRILGFVLQDMLGSEVQKEINVVSQILSDVVQFANDTRKAYLNGSSEEFITTRSLINIVRGMIILGDLRKSIRLTCQRFSDVERDAFMNLFEKSNSGKNYALNCLKKSDKKVTETLTDEFVIETVDAKVVAPESEETTIGQSLASGPVTTATKYTSPQNTSTLVAP